MPYFEASIFVLDTVTSLEKGVSIYRKYLLLVEAPNQDSATQKARSTSMGEWDITEETRSHYALATMITLQEVEVPF